MPGTTGYDPNLDSELWKANEKAGDEELRARRAVYTRAWQYYDGEHKRHLKLDQRGRDDNVTLNKVGQVDDSAVSNLMGRSEEGQAEGVRFDVVDGSGADGGIFGPLRRVARKVQGKKSPQQDYLNRVWQINTRALFQHNLALNGAVCGHCFVRIVPQGIYYWPTRTSVPRLINLDPGAVTVFWDAGDVGRPLFYRLEFGSDGARTREDIVRNLNDDGSDAHGWTIYRWQETKSDSAARWTPSADPEPWKFEWCPIIDWPNLPQPNKYYGKPDHGKAGQLNDAANFTASNLQRILKLHAHPKRFGTGFQADDLLPTAVDDFWAISNENAKINQLEMLNDLSSSMAFLQLMLRSIFDEGRELDPQSVQDKLGDLTNFGLRVLNGQVLGKIGTKRMLYGDKGFTPINQALLQLGGYDPATEVVNQWPDALPVDQLAEAQALDVDRRHGASQISYLERRGYDPETELQRRDYEAQQEDNATLNFLTAAGKRGFS